MNTKPGTSREPRPGTSEQHQETFTKTGGTSRYKYDRRLPAFRSFAVSGENGSPVRIPPVTTAEIHFTQDRKSTVAIPKQTKMSTKQKQTKKGRVTFAKELEAPSVANIEFDTPQDPKTTGAIRKQYNIVPKQKKSKIENVSYCRKLAVSDLHTDRLRTRSRSVPEVFIGDYRHTSVAQFLDVNNDFLENYILKMWDVEKFESLYFKKLSLVEGTTGEMLCGDFPRHLKHFHPTDLGLMSVKRHLRKGQPISWLLKSTLSELEKNERSYCKLWSFVKHVTYKLGVDAFRIYVLDPENPRRVRYLVVEIKGHRHSETLKDADSTQAHFVLEVARTENILLVSRGMQLKFPDFPHDLFASFGLYNIIQANHILYMPLLNSFGRCTYVVEMWRVKTNFSNHEKEHVAYLMLWASVSLNFMGKYEETLTTLKTADAMLRDVKSLFEHMVSLDQVVKRILEFVQKLVKADRASLFLVDERTQELVSTVFDLKLGSNDGDTEKKEIRIPIHSGIAGHVARTGETMNIVNAYGDPRFNRRIDQETGYKTNTILCMPVKANGNVVGVVQMVNKRGSRTFLNDDEKYFERCAPFFGLALHHANLYEQIVRKEQQNRVTLDVLSYHNTCKQHEVNTLLSNCDKIKQNLNDYYLDPFKFNEMKKCKATIQMFYELFGEYSFDKLTVTRFVLTVKKNYRQVPYHNFNHGWSVAHSMFVILKTDELEHFNFREALALFVAAYCHDLDHRGYTNQYMSETSSPLAAMYTTSTLEHHHFNITATILQQEGHNIFGQITADEYKEVLEYIRHCILATDLAAFFPNATKMKRLIGDKSVFDWLNKEHRSAAMAMCMTAADLSASAKPWHIQKKTVNEIFAEFYNQGDKEREIGKTPMPMMDRTKKHEQPASQVGFLTQICKPCYQILATILPNTKPMLVMVMNNLIVWQSKIDKNEILSDNDKPEEEDSLEEISSMSTEENDGHIQNILDDLSISSTSSDNNSRFESAGDKFVRRTKDNVPNVDSNSDVSEAIDEDEDDVVCPIIRKLRHNSL